MAGASVLRVFFHKASFSIKILQSDVLKSAEDFLKLQCCNLQFSTTTLALPGLFSDRLDSFGGHFCTTTSTTTITSNLAALGSVDTFFLAFHLQGRCAACIRVEMAVMWSCPLLQCPISIISGAALYALMRMGHSDSTQIPHLSFHFPPFSPRVHPGAGNWLVAQLPLAACDF